MAYTITQTLRKAVCRAGIAVFVLMLLATLAGCSDGEEVEAPDVDLLASSGTYSTTVVPDTETEIPLSDVIYVTARFEEEIYGLAGQTAVRMTTEPPSYRIEQQRPPDLQTYRVALIRPEPGTVTVSLYENSQAEPVGFTLVIGAEESVD